MNGRDELFSADGPAAVATVSHLRILDSLWGIDMSDGGGNQAVLTVDHTLIRRMLHGGILATTAAGGSLTVTDSTFTWAAGVYSTLTSLTFERNLMTDSCCGLNVQAADIDVVDNVITADTGVGLDVQSPWNRVDPATAVTVSGNVVRGNAGTGVRLTGLLAPGALVSDNHLVGNGTIPVTVDPGDGILVDLGATAANVTLRGNHARGNRGWGIDAPGVVDGGGNEASGNAPGSACRGVVCGS